MSISDKSRYVWATRQQVISDRGRYVTTYVPPVIYRGQAYTVYVAVKGDTFEQLATVFYGDPTVWWRIADANPHVFHPDILGPGTLIRIPQ